MNPIQIFSHAKLYKTNMYSVLLSSLMAYASSLWYISL